MKVILINPPDLGSDPDRVTRFDAGGMAPPAGLLYLYSYLRNRTRHEPVFLDALAARLSVAQVAELAAEAKADGAGITSYTPTMGSVLRTADAIKKVSPTTIVCVGGFHATHHPRDVAASPNVDFAVAGEGEVAFERLLDALGSGRPPRHPPGVWSAGADPGSPPDPVDGVEPVDRALPPDLLRPYFFLPMPGRGRLAPLLTARGCPFRCLYCKNTVGFRQYPIASIAEQIAEYLDLGVQRFFVVDNLGAARLHELAEAILATRLRPSWTFKTSANITDVPLLRLARRAGCRLVRLNVSTATDEGLEFLRMGCTRKGIAESVRAFRRAGIVTQANFCIGYPFEHTEAAVLETLDFAFVLPVDYANFLLSYAYPGSDLYDYCLSHGIITHGLALEWSPALTNDRIPKERFVELQRQAFRRFYLRPGFIARELLRATSWEGALARAQVAVGLLKRN